MSVRTLASIESNEGTNPKPETLKTIRDTLVKGGVKFIKVNGGGAGVRLRAKG